MYFYINIELLEISFHASGSFDFFGYCLSNNIFFLLLERVIILIRVNFYGPYNNLFNQGYSIILLSTYAIFVENIGLAFYVTKLILDVNLFILFQ